MGAKPLSICIEVRCERIPSACAGVPVYLGIQSGRDVVQIVPGKIGRVLFAPEFRLKDKGDQPNFLGPFAQGSRDERFIYLSWGHGKTGPHFKMFRRLKLHLSHLRWSHLETAASRNAPLRVTIDLTDECGNPRCASVRSDHPAVAWKLH